MATQDISLTGGTPKELVATGSLAVGKHTIQFHGPGELHLINKATALSDINDALDERGIIMFPFESTVLDVTTGAKTYAWSPDDSTLSIDT